MAVTERGREARTRYRVLERFRAHTLVEVELETGRTHQIRVHMAHIRAPLVGDPVYGGRPRLPPAPSDELRVALQAFRRQALHARRGSHSLIRRRGVALRFESPLPRDLADAARDSCARTPGARDERRNRLRARLARARRRARVGQRSAPAA